MANKITKATNTIQMIILCILLKSKLNYFSNPIIKKKIKFLGTYDSLDFDNYIKLNNIYY